MELLKLLTTNNFDDMNRQAMIFAAGVGSRLRPLTDHKPKALVEVNGIPMIDRVIHNLVSNGFERIIINVHHFADMIIKHLESHGEYGADIIISDERHKLLDTAGGVRKALGSIDINLPLLVHNADILTDINLSEMYGSLDCFDALLLCSAERKSSRYLLFDHNRRMHGWINDKDGTVLPDTIIPESMIKLAFGGIHILGPSLLSALRDRLKPDTPYSIIPFYIDMCGTMNIHAHMPKTSYQWHDIGSLEKLHNACSSFIE